MNNLTFGPDAPMLAQLFAAAILFLHIAGGGIGIASGTAALLLPKGKSLHRLCGKVFFVSMCIAFGIGATVAPFLHSGQRPNTIAGTFALYLVVSSWLAVRRRAPGVRLVDIAGLAVALATAIAGAILIQLASHSPTGTIDGSPPQSFYVFLVLGSIASIDDALFIARGGHTGAARIARHLWRMCAALFFASGSLFMGQPQVFPASIRGSALLFLPVLLPILVMLYYLLRLVWQAVFVRRTAKRTEPRTAELSSAI